MAWVTVAQSETLQPGQMTKVTVGDDDILICNVEGAIYAIADICSHAVASLSEGTLDGAIVTCPRHGGQFDVTTGNAVHFPAFSPVKTYAVKVENGAILLDADDIEDDE